MGQAESKDRLTEEPVEAAKSGFAAVLDQTIEALVAEGFEIRCIFMSPDDTTRLFVEAGEDAILMDSDPASDRAWYGRYELSPTTDAETLILYCKDDECWFKALPSA